MPASAAMQGYDRLLPSSLLVAISRGRLAVPEGAPRRSCWNPEQPQARTSTNRNPALLLRC
jgi:hypothetical protein